MRGIARLLMAGAVLGLGGAPLQAGKSVPTVQGMTSVASYQTPGLCFEGPAEKGAILLQPCAITERQLFFGKFEGNTATGEQHMSLKYRDKYGCVMTFAYLEAVGCPDNSWWKGNYFHFDRFGFLTNLDRDSAIVDNMADAAPGVKLSYTKEFNVTNYAKAGFYPVVLVPRIKLDKALTELVRAAPGATGLVTDNGFSGLNLVAAYGAHLTVNAKGEIATGTGAPILLGGSGKLIRKYAAKVVVMPGVPAPLDYNPQTEPRQIEFFAGKKPGKIPLGPLY